MDLTDDKDAGTGDDLLKEAKERHKLCTEAWSDNRAAWLEDQKFRNLEQWPEKIKKLREDSGRPVVVVDKLNQYVRQVVNDGRQNRPGVKVRPEGNGADADAAEAFEDLIRGICARSNADEAYDTALDHAAGNGYGFFRVISDYVHPGTFNQELKVRRVRNPRSVMLDPFIQLADGSDARYGFVEIDMPKDDFKVKYPKAKFTNWEDDATKSQYGEGWLTDKSVKICEYYYTVDKPELVHLLDDGETMSDADYQAAMKELTPGAPSPQIVQTRELPVTQVKWCCLTGAEVLEENDWLGKYIPIVLVIGNEQEIDGKVIYSGLIRSAKDPQRLYNYSRAAYAERVALTPKAPFVAARGQVENNPEWEDANTENYSVLVYDPIDVNGTPIAPPQRQSAADIPEGFARDMQLSEHDIQGAMGMYNASLGEKSNEKSGRAIMARQREGDTGTFHYPDNLNRAIRYLGRILVDAAPKYYDSRRTVHLLGEDGSQRAAEINPDQTKPVEDVGGKKIYNFGVGVYGVDITAGPSYTTKRQEALEAGMQLAQANPAIWQLVGDIIVKNADWPGADEMADRLKMALPPPIQQMLQAKEQGQDPKILAAVGPLKQQLDAAQQQIQAAESGIAQRDQALQQQGQELQKTQQENDALKSDRELNAGKLELERAKAYNERLKLENEARNTPPDPMAAEAMRLEHEDKWKKWDADKAIIVAAIGAKQATQTAAIGAAAQAQTDAQPDPTDSIEAPEVDTNGAVAMAIQNLAEAMGRTKTATLPDGRQITLS